MRAAITLTLALALSACATTPAPDLGEAAPVSLPDLPANLDQPAQPLPPSRATTLAELVEEGINDDARYNSLRTRYDALLGLYKCAKEAIENRQQPNC
ncbi:hypothetical protein GRI62_11790 [Erythrobacter arachoides]|uniref:Uncharacterized protein n=1 Tax=Aurantiacibacter arachoides TaxID=1850444 RepID=A0A845A5R8_9SPHN|nr:hypothetical protein [Aurantiacibacter arachoides]MXO94277.1 hypothetical protein [Aurantiacibacter arachoides]GGD64744.1 hypothetical protein GCM10011411_26310 [Aurantiacibacter arachoides]